MPATTTTKVSISNDSDDAKDVQGDKDALKSAAVIANLNQKDKLGENDSKDIIRDTTTSKEKNNIDNKHLDIDRKKGGNK